MRYIDLALIDKKDPDVIGWLNKARLYLNELSKKTTHDERKEYMAAHGIWSQFKPILIKYYGEKCWYSECSLEGAFGEIDHFRPKNKSTDEKKNEILPDGYWWLAYDYLNYRLSCEKSNRSYGDGGKNDMLPSSSAIFLKLHLFSMPASIEILSESVKCLPLLDSKKVFINRNSFHVGA